MDILTKMLIATSLRKTLNVHPLVMDNVPCVMLGRICYKFLPPKGGMITEEASYTRMLSQGPPEVLFRKSCGGKTLVCMISKFPSDYKMLRFYP